MCGRQTGMEGGFPNGRKFKKQAVCLIALGLSVFAFSGVTLYLFRKRRVIIMHRVPSKCRYGFECQVGLTLEFKRICAVCTVGLTSKDSGPAFNLKRSQATETLEQWVVSVRQLWVSSIHKYQCPFFTMWWVSFRVFSSFTTCLGFFLRWEKVKLLQVSCSCFNKSGALKMNPFPKKMRILKRSRHHTPIES